MKNGISTLLIVFLGFSPSVAQKKSSLYSNKIDSLQKVIENHTPDDRTKIELLNEFAQTCFYANHFRQGLIATHKAKVLSQKIGFQKGIGLFYRTMSIFHQHEFYSILLNLQGNWLFTTSHEKDDYFIKTYSTLPINPKVILDSLHLALAYFQSNSQKEIKANILLNLGVFIAQSENKSSRLSVSYFDQALIMFRELKQPIPVLFTQQFLANYFNRRDDKKEALGYEKQSLELLRVSPKDQMMQGIVNVLMAQMTLQFNSTIDYYLQSKKAVEGSGQKNFVAYLNSRLANAYGTVLDDHQKALYHLNEFLKNPPNKNINNEIDQIKISKSVQLIHLRHFREACIVLNDLKPLVDSLKIPYVSGKFYDAQGQYYDLLGQYKEAILNYNQSFNYFYDNKFITQACYLGIYLAESYFKSGEYLKGIEHGKQAYQIALALREPLQIRSSLILSKLYDKIGASQKAFDFLKIHQRTLEAQNEKEILNRLAALEIQSIIDKSRQEIELLEKDKQFKEEQIKNQRTWLGSILIALLSVLILSFNMYINIKNKHKSNALLTKQRNEIEEKSERMAEQSEQLRTLMRELHHRVKNNLAIVSSLLNLQTYRLTDDGAIEAVQESQRRVEAMSLIHQRLYRTDTVTTIDMAHYITDLVESLMAAYGFEPDTFDLTIRVEDPEVDVDIAIPLGLIMNELLTNAFKYAYSSNGYRIGLRKRPALHIALQQTNGLTLEVQDNGPGLDLHQWRSPDAAGRSAGAVPVETDSFGRQLIYSLTEQIGGQLTVDNRNGAYFQLCIASPV